MIEIMIKRIIPFPIEILALSFSFAPKERLNKAAAPSPIKRAKARAMTVKGRQY